MGIGDFLKENYNRYNWIGSTRARQGERQRVKELRSIDLSRRGEPTIRTTIDCYLTGSYIQRTGKSSKQGRQITFRQRYSISIRYSTSTANQIYSEVRQEIIRSFESQFAGTGVQINDVFVPTLGEPTEPSPVQLYTGGRMWKLVTRTELKRRELTTADAIHKANIRGIIRKYSRIRELRK